MKAETAKNTAGDRAQRAEGEKRTLGGPSTTLASGSPFPKAFGVNLSHSSPAGFTMVEVLTALVIVVILAGLVVYASKYALTKAAVSRTESEIAGMEMALEHYKNDNGAYPRSTTTRRTPSGYPSTIEIYNSTNLYSALSGKYFTFNANETRVEPTSGKTYVVDPFGAPYNYYCNPGAVNQTNTASFDLWSYGPNGFDDEGTNDDIANWQPH